MQLEAEYAVYSQATEGQEGAREGSCSGQAQHPGIVVVGRKEGLIRDSFLEEVTEYQERVRSEGEQDRSVVRRVLEGHV